MIAMLRRRLMGDMAKAKKIVTGTVAINQSSVKVLTIPAFGFIPDYVAVFAENGSASANIVVSIFNGHVNYIRYFTMSGYDGLYYDRKTMDIENVVSENGVTYTMPSVNSYFYGDYRYVAWQE